MLDLDEALTIVRDHLHRRRAHVDRIAEFWNGFEGWLKFELAVALRKHNGIEAWRRTEDGTWAFGDVGVEYRYRRAPSASADAEEILKEKLIDFWYGHSPTLYFELKTVFANANQGKQIRSWCADFKKLEAVLSEEAHVAGYASVLISIGFDDNTWNNALINAEVRDRLHGAFWDGGLIVKRRAGAVRLCALRHSVLQQS